MYDRSKRVQPLWKPIEALSAPAPAEQQVSEQAAAAAAAEMDDARRYCAPTADQVPVPNIPLTPSASGASCDEDPTEGESSVATRRRAKKTQSTRRRRNKACQSLGPQRKCYGGPRTSHGQIPSVSHSAGGRTAITHAHPGVDGSLSAKGVATSGEGVRPVKARGVDDSDEFKDCLANDDEPEAGGAELGSAAYDGNWNPAPLSTEKIRMIVWTG